MGAHGLLAGLTLEVPGLEGQRPELTPRPRPEATCDPALLGALPDFLLLQGKTPRFLLAGAGPAGAPGLPALRGSPELRSQKPRPWALPLRE